MGTFLPDLKTTQLVVNPLRCPLLHEALMGAYAWQVDQNGQIMEGKPAKIHPFADVADCARYLALHANSGTVSGSGRAKLSVVKRQGSWDSPRAKHKRDETGWVNQLGS
jgi:hypothetical protein